MADLERPGGSPERHEGEPHLPSPTIWPVGFAAGIALLLIGLVIGNWPIVAVGAGLTIAFGFLWIREVTREVRVRPVPEPVAAPPTHVLAEAEEEAEEERYTRSRFLEGTTLGLGAVIGGIVTAPIVGFAVAPAFVGQGYDDVDLGPLENFPEGEYVVVQFVSEREEGPVSRRTAFVRNNGFANDAPSFTIVSNRCVHLGCPTQPGGLLDEPKSVETDSGEVLVTPAQGITTFACPCHGGAYDGEGNRTAGPPVRSLDRYKYSIQNGRLVLGEPYSVGKVIGTGAEAQIRAYDPSDPGVHVDGPEQILYPYVP